MVRKSEGLTQNELLLLECAAHGVSDEQLANIRGRSVNTIRNEWTTLRRKFLVKNKTAAVIKAVKSGILKI